MDALITADNTWALWAILLTAAALGTWGERTALGARFSGAVITLLTTFALSNLRVIPAAAPVYDTVWTYLVPLAIPLLLFSADLRRIVHESGATLIAFALGALGTVMGTIAAFHLIPLGEQGWQLAAIFSATYIGGSMNYMGAAEAVGLRTGDLLTAGIAADNLMMTLYFLLLFTLPSLRWLQTWYPTPLLRDTSSLEGALTLEPPPPPRLHLSSLITGLALSSLICAISFTLEAELGGSGSGILILTALTVTLATLLPRQMAKLEGAHELGLILMQVFFAAIGASANITVVLTVGPVLFGFAGLILAIHLMTLLIGGKLFKLSLPEMVVASNANMGGPTTAVAMAAARRWDPLVIPAILCGTLGYATATFIGVALGSGLKP
ncbi:protein of unknown function DUF819 [Nitrosococcus halophilus Nc 4]|uniref:DUF819 family protein n=1 Tax=Nitrosococcus halophilus (strain Nc4) TaxID=472759 RepID=D5C4C6_NITHN|nr:DUF819 family protein [Nitrosococcus halophilus]ADE15110.1 protein of unknown function DUF819 [Nitrosococcus halophilus Nc 4]